ncbi:hypothetical protein [Rubrivirga sp. IMCC43871]|uniref:hypothetical protein n=1 Tax=Rubrivirga sp. IMCC43871 TaxID=3391575 RepID=UPI0039901151
MESDLNTRPVILICDDEKDREDRWRSELADIEAVSNTFDIQTARVPGSASSGDDHVTDNRLSDIVAALEHRRLRARTDGYAPGSYTYDDEAKILDATDILVIDYDLLMIGVEEANRQGGADSEILRRTAVSHLTGERVSYLARAYSKCGLVVAMNQFAKDKPTFDLNLTGHPRSYADLNIASQELSNPGLWVADRTRWDAYRPWRWPVLSDAVAAHRRRVADLLEGDTLDRSVVEYLGFPEGVAESMSRHVVDFIVSDSAASIVDVTFRQVAMESDIGFRRKDRPLDEESVAQVAAGRVAHWIERLVLPPQDIIVDAPHLASRYPSLVDNSDDPNVWNGTADLAQGMDSVLDDAPFHHARFARQHWGSRPMWFWDTVGTTESIPEVAEPWKAESPAFVFAEDCSRFIKSEDARTFVADVTSPYARRFAQKLDGVDYRPSVRFSM